MRGYMERIYDCLEMIQRRNIHADQCHFDSCHLDFIVGNSVLDQLKADS